MHYNKDTPLVTFVATLISLDSQFKNKEKNIKHFGRQWACKIYV